MERLSRLQKLKNSRNKGNNRKRNFRKKVNTGDGNQNKKQSELEIEGDENRLQEEMEWEDEYEDIYEEEKTIKTSMKKGKVQNIVPFMGTRNDLTEGQVMEFSNIGYTMYHRAMTEWPCLSVDFLLPNFQTSPSLNNITMVEEFEYPLELYAVAGSQADFTSQNQLYVMRFTDLAQTKYDDNEDDGGIDIEGETKINKGKDVDLEPVLFSERFQLFSATNRIRSMYNSPIVALMNQTGQLQIFDVSKNLQNLSERDIHKSEKTRNSDCTKILGNFQLSTEGFGLNWSKQELGLLACGTNDGVISLFRPANETFSDFVKSEHLIKAHEQSVEDIQFSPAQTQVLASCSADKSIKVFDLRDPSSMLSSSISINSHNSDVNVISWNTKNPNLLASGDDEGIFKVFDLRYPTKSAITDIQFHQDSICSIEWQPHDEWTLTVGSLDSRVSLWDLSVESDEQGVSSMLDESENKCKSAEEVPEQLLFLHQGQEELREVRWHPVYKGVMMSTALDSFNVFQPCLDEFEDVEDDDEFRVSNSPNDLVLN